MRWARATRLLTATDARVTYEEDGEESARAFRGQLRLIGNRTSAHPASPQVSETAPLDKGSSDMPYSPRDNAEAWCRGLTRGPVKAEIAGSNPVASAASRNHSVPGFFLAERFTHRTAPLGSASVCPFPSKVATVASLRRENSARRPLGSIDDGQLVTARPSSSIPAAITLPPREHAKHESSARQPHNQSLGVGWSRPRTYRSLPRTHRTSCVDPVAVPCLRRSAVTAEPALAPTTIPFSPESPHRRTRPAP
jgi:hypothetical protein